MNSKFSKIRIRWTKCIKLIWKSTICIECSIAKKKSMIGYIKSIFRLQQLWDHKLNWSIMDWTNCVSKELNWYCELIGIASWFRNIQTKPRIYLICLLKTNNLAIVLSFTQNYFYPELLIFIEFTLRLNIFKSKSYKSKVTFIIFIRENVLIWKKFEKKTDSLISRIRHFVTDMQKSFDVLKELIALEKTDIQNTVWHNDVELIPNDDEVAIGDYVVGSFFINYNWNF